MPDELKPKIADPAAELADGPRKRAQQKPPPPAEKPEPRPIPTNEQANKQTSGRQAGASQGSNSAVALQVLEGQTPASARPQPRPVVQTETAVPTKVSDLPPPEEDFELAGELTPEEESHVRELKARDREVRAHEAAHATAGSGYTGAPAFEYVTGPDGTQYAVGGHVEIDTSKVPDNPEATIAKMEVVRRAALAPARPSGQDRAVAAAAEQALREAQSELREKRTEEAAEQPQAPSGGPDGDIGGDISSPFPGQEASAEDQSASFSGQSGVPPRAPTQISIDLIA